MATKINESIWGTVPQTGYSIRPTPNSLGACYNNGTFDPGNISNMDKSIVPWGVPYCGLGGMSFLKMLRTPTPIEGGAIKTGILSTFEIEEFINTNNPIALMYTGSLNSSSNYNWFSHRLSGGVKSSGSSFASDAAWDKDSSIATGGPSMWGYRPVCYLDYQNVIVQVKSIIVWDRKTGTDYETRNIAEIPGRGITWDDYELIGFTYGIYYRNPDNTWGLTSTDISTIPIGEKDTSEFVLDRYFGQNVRPQKWSPYTYTGIIKTMPLNTSFGVSANTIPKESDSETLNSSSVWTYILKSLGNYINGSQTFDDISYSMKPVCGIVVNGTWYEIVKGQELPGTESVSNNMVQLAVYYKIKDHEAGTSKADAWLKIIAHEIAFLGLPFQIRVNNNAGTPATNASIADDDVYLPIFDIQHMVTTGRYTTDITTKQVQPNYAWNNVFDSTIPDWDSTYNPPKPSGGDEGEDDFGDLTNSRPTRYGTSGTKKYVCSASTINSLQSFLNVSYTPDNINFIADFKGTNPADYIVSIQRYPFPLPHLSSTASILIGGVDSALTANPLETELYPVQHVFDFGSITIPEYYGDFRDYESKITLFLPFIGSVDLDPRLFIGHLLSIDYIIDYDTGSIAAEIQRDGLTIETKTAHISVTIPFFAADMGAYQNALAQTGFAIEQSKIKQISGIASTAISAGGAIAGAGAGLSDIGGASVAGGLIGGTASMVSGLVQMQSLEYQLDHTAPSIGTLSVAAPANAFYMDDRARVLIIRPKMLHDYSAEDYSHTVGNACAIPGKLGSFSGYTVAAAADLSGIPATAAEKAMIRKQLQAGVYV